MQKIIIVLAAMMVMVSCAQKKYGNFTLTASIKNAPAGQMLYVEKFALTNADNEILDSVKLKASGEYTLKGTGTEEGLYLLTIEHKPFMIFINDYNHIKASVDMTHSHYPDFDGSPASKNLYAFVSFYGKRDSALREISDRMDMVQKTNPPDSAVQSLRMLGMSELQSLNDEIASIVRNSTSPALICFALDKARNTMELTDVDSLALKATTRFKNHAGLAIIKTQLTEALAQQQQQNPSADSYALLNKQAPDLTMPGLDGKTLSISNFRGKYLLVDFWASWCGPCRGENPNVVAAYNKYKDKNFTILGVSLDQDKASWVQAIKKDGLNWNQMSDLKYWNSAAVNAYQFDGIPFNVLIDPDGKIIASSLRGPALEAKLAEVLK
ncbi:MAG TPA: TlpA disulfide reductase family protein [Chitinophagaceae bacterium]|nr:TlpA disulfide reductase family protein [Chitinophagaceae bacterium]